MKRLCIFVIYDSEHVLREPTVYLLENLSDVADDVVSVVNGALPEDDVHRLDALSTSVIVRENMGFDAGAYKDVLEPLVNSGGLEEYDELILCNDTFFGPFHPFGDVFGTMDGVHCDFWGMSRHPACPGQGIPEHIQAYFLVFRKTVLSDENFTAFWKSLPYPQSYGEAVQNFEIALSQMLFACGFIGGTYSEACGWLTRKEMNNYVFFPLELMRDARFPLLKKRAMRDDVSDIVSLAPAVRYIKENTGYPVDWIYEYWLGLYGDRPAGKDMPAGLPYFTVNDIEDFYKKHSRVFVYGHGRVAS